MYQTITASSNGSCRRVITVNITLDAEDITGNEPIVVEIDLNKAGGMKDDKTIDIVKGFKQYAEEYQKHDQRMVKACARQFEEFCHAQAIDVPRITREVCHQFCDWLYERLMAVHNHGPYMPLMWHTRTIPFNEVH